MPFTSDLVAKELKRPGWWQLVEDLVYRGRDDTFTVPAGFETDFASVPQLFLWLVPRSGKYAKAAVLHDYLSRELTPDDMAAPQQSASNVSCLLPLSAAHL